MADKQAPTPPTPTPAPEPPPSNAPTTTADFTVILSDLADAAKAFHAGAKAFASAMPGNLKYTTVASGDPTFDQITAQLLTLLDEMHKQLSDRLDGTGTSLDKVHDSYQQSNVAAWELYDNLMRAK